jgi:hypothetical protein
MKKKEDAEMEVELEDDDPFIRNYAAFHGLEYINILIILL